MGKHRKRRLRAPSASMVVAFLALCLALGGTSFAATRLAANSVGTKQLKNRAVTAPKIGAIPGARVQRTVGLTTASSSSSVVSYDAVDFNVGGVFDAGAPNRMTAPLTGRYLITASARWASISDVGRRTIALNVNGTGPQIARSNVSPYLSGGAAFNPEQTVSTVYKLNAGDYVEVWALQDSGGPLDLAAWVDNGVTFSMVWMAP